MAKERGIPVFDYEGCVACVLCVLSCPFGCIEMSRLGVDQRYKNKPYPTLVHVGTCTGCQLCEKDCPVDCITMMLPVAV